MAEASRITVLGPVTASRDGEPVKVRGTTGRTVLACLALAEGRPVSVDRLMASLWDDAPPPGALGTIHSAISRLRAGLGSAAVVREGDAYRLDPEAASTDLETLALLTRAASAAEDPADAAALLGDALALWRGDALVDVAATTALLAETARLEELRATLRDRWYLARLDAGETAEVVADLQRDARTAPLREPTQLLLMRALGDAGRTAEALRVGAEYRRRLADETGLDPSPALASLERTLLDDTLDAPAEPEERTRRAAAHLARRSWTPPDNEFVGRDDVEAAARGLLDRSRLVTILGPGGVGKTRLAMELVAGDQTGEVVVVELAAVAPTGDVAATLAGELDLKSSGTDLLAALAERLDLFGALLVLDNCEHVRSQARDLVEHVLRRAPSVRILVTSRRRLGLPDEHVVRLGPLPVPDRPSADQPTIRLFLDRVRRLDPATLDGPEVLPAAAAICRATDGIPLAIELAASRVGLLGLEGLARQLAGSLDVLSLAGGDTRRQATLDSTIAWSIDLLPPDAVRALEELAVFPDRFDLADAEVVALSPHPLSAVAELVDSSLLAVDTAGGSTRYRMLEPIRQHARRRLEATGRAGAAADAHATWVLSLGSRMEGWWTGDETLRSARELAARRADLVAALDHLHRTGRGGDVDRLARQIGMVLIEHPDVGFSTLIPVITGDSIDGAVARAVIGSSVGRPRAEELADLERALATIEPDDPRRHFLRFAFVPAQQYQGDIEGAVATCRTMIDDPDTPPRLRVLAVAMWALAEGFMGRFAHAQAILDDHEAVLALSDIGGFVAYVRAEVANGTDTEAALAHLDEANRLSCDAPTSFVAASAKALNLSLLVHTGRVAEACELARRLAPELLTAGTVPHAWRALRALAHVLVAQGDAVTAARVLAAAELDPRAPVVLGHWNDTIQRQWRLIDAALGAEQVAAIRAGGASLSIAELWGEVEAALP